MIEVATDDDVVEEFDLQEGGGFFELLGDAAVGLARGGVTGGVVVGEDEGVAEVEDDGAQNFAWVGEGFVDEAASDFFHVDEAEAAVEDEDVEDFLAEVGGERGEKFVNNLGFIEDGAGEIFAGHAGSELERGEELAGFGEAEAVLFGDFFDAESAQVADAAVLLDELAADLDGAVSFGAGAQENGEKFVRGQRAGTESSHFFTRAFIIGEVLDAR